RQHKQWTEHYPRRFLAVAGEITSRFAKKNDNHRTRNIKGGEKRGRQSDDEDRRVPRVGQGKDRVFAEKSAEGRATDQRERAGGKCAECNFQFRRQATLFPNVLLVMETDDNRAGGKEEQCFEKCVREKVKHRRVVGREPNGHDHVTKL